MITTTYANQFGPGFLNNTRRILEKEGIQGFYKENLANMIRVIPGTAAGFFTTMTIVHWLCQQNVNQKSSKNDSPSNDSFIN